MDWLDLIVAVLLAGFGLVLAVILAFEGGTPVQVGLVVFTFATGTLWWVYTSWGWEPIRRWRERRSNRASG